MKKYVFLVAILVLAAFVFHRMQKIDPITIEDDGRIPLSLDGFFSGIENGCSKNPALSEALSSMASPLPEHVGWEPNSRLLLPPPLDRHFGTPGKTDGNSDYTMLRVSISDATYHGFPVRELHQWLGHGNGVNGFSFVLSASPEEVGRKLESAMEIVDSCQTDPYCGEPFEMKLSPYEGMTQVICDTSM
jgi:hypothetical protein